MNFPAPPPTLSLVDPIFHRETGETDIPRYKITEDIDKRNIVVDVNIIGFISTRS